MSRTFPIFKTWVPGWLIKVVLFSTILPSMVLFFLPLANINAAAGHYGGEPADIQFAVALFYAGYAGFYSLERRFFSYLATKEYFLIFTVLQILFSTACYVTNELYLLFPLRFIQGMLFASTVNLSLALMFTRLKTERAREVSFSVFFCMLLIAMPFNNLVTADIIDSFNFNIVYKCAVFSYLPGLLLVLIAMNNVRLNIRFPLYKLDWQSFALLSLLLVIFGYCMIYGQEYYWLTDPRIAAACIAGGIALIVFIVRQFSMKRPYADMRVFKSRNFNVGLLLLLVLYICRFASGITNSFFATAFKFDPMHISYINTFNMAGLIAGVVLSCCMILQKKKIRLIWLPGFVLLFLFHFLMLFLFNPEANPEVFFLPLFLQGMGVGMLLVPIIVFGISSVPVILGSSASAFLLITRYVGFCFSIALINYYELYGKSKHYNTFQENLTLMDLSAKKQLAAGVGRLASRGLLKTEAHRGTPKLMVNAINTQTHMRFAIDYYESMCWLLLITLLGIMLLPYLNKTIVYLRSKQLSPA